VASPMQGVKTSSTGDQQQQQQSQQGPGHQPPQNPQVISPNSTSSAGGLAAAVAALPSPVRGIGMGSIGTAGSGALQAVGAPVFTSSTPAYIGFSTGPSTTGYLPHSFYHAAHATAGVHVLTHGPPQTSVTGGVVITGPVPGMVGPMAAHAPGVPAANGPPNGQPPTVITGGIATGAGGKP
jgi:hypothetical protein